MIGLALGGGGARGAYEIGVLRALDELKIPIGAITGTSIGAVNAAAYLLGDLDGIEAIWRSLGRDSLITYKDINIPEVIRKKGFDFEKLMGFLKEILNEETIRKNPVDLGLVTYNLTTREPVVLFKEDIPAGKLAEYVGASANHPSFQRLVIDGEAYIDGAVYDNIPVKPLVDRGYREIIAVNLKTTGSRKDLSGPYHLLEIESRHDLGSILFPDPDTISRNIRYGYLDTLKALGQLHGSLYRFRTLEDSVLLTALSAEEIRFLRETLPPSLLEKTLDGFRKDSPADPDYGLVLASLEITAEVLHVDSTVIYPSPRNLLDEVLLTIRQRMADRKLPLSDRIIFKNLDSSALKALSLATPKLAVANLFLTLLQKRMIGD